MKTQKLTLEIAEPLFKQLEQVAQISSESIETIAIRIIAMRLPSLSREVQELQEMLDSITTDQLHGEIVLEETVD
ncbi:hypothetical protein NIES2119_16185 [[Phormidium ambiguum] IAM M-71]|uniref:Uncharacterized protein n=1 Tax=[Phormidium ambiguum] IAM M-71 TaxID=454136 RepID=A0A1U7IHL3_9CYAN|nr:hypothetical protein [Phormidium ambiguum]OKH36570.1 hypothetical protein NIES2119_16185 [Phormidium ambiguum IAM M-71]